MKNKSAVDLGRLGGRVVSEAKSSAARSNGRLGGRPKKAIAAAHSALNAAVRSGKMDKPKACPECGGVRRRIEAHHRDHGNPLDVEWVCSACHGKLRERLLMWGDMDAVMRAQVKAQAKRDGVSLRALILSLLKAWVETRRGQ